MTPPAEVAQLVQRFEQQPDDYRSGRYKEMFSLHNEGVATTPQDKTLLQRQIDATDRQIDRLVYQLYDVTDKGIAIVEEPKVGTVVPEGPWLDGQ